jgi:hypothetical protein
VARYDAAGALSWASRAGGAGEDYAFGIAAAADGGAFVVGYFDGEATFGETAVASAGHWDLFVARYEASGSVSWVKTAGGAQFDVATGVCALPDGGALVTGYIYEQATFGVGEPSEATLVSAGLTDVFVAGFGATGELVWADRAGGPDLDVGAGIATADGDVVVTGFFTGDATFGGRTLRSSAGSLDAFLAGYDETGALRFAARAGGPEVDFGAGDAVAGEGRSYVTGQLAGTAVFGEGEPGETVLTTDEGEESALFVAAYDAGLLAWARRAGPAHDDLFRQAVAALAGGGVIVAGGFEFAAVFAEGEPEETILTTEGMSDVFVAAYRADATLGWAARAGGPGDDIARGAATLPDGGAYVTGTFAGMAEPGVWATFFPGEASETRLQTAGTADAFIARFWRP